jgi:XTP/dITP diphosphohydrolase
MTPLVIASHNEGKVKEIRTLLAPLGMTVMSAAALNLPEPEENGTTFAENAELKSRSAAMLSGHYALSDDSGLCVPGLDGAPGIYSARWAGAAKNFSLAIERIEREIKNKDMQAEGQPAYFICVLSLTSPEGETHTFEGRVDGTLTFPPRGADGFGYDPVFIPAGHNQTFSEMEPVVKNALSHRARAFDKFIAYARTVKSEGAK